RQVETRGAKVVDLTLHASASTRPALQYPLLPNITDQKPGNGAPIYHAAAKIGPDPKAADDLTIQLGNRYGEMPFTALASSDFPAAIQTFADRLNLLDIAARREDTRWETTLRDQGAGAMLLYLNDLRVNVRI